MKYIIVGTAGHVDHGKTELTRALTGVASDRLKEEQERGISITLGFAPFTLADGQKIGLVDVPGHEKFVKQMLAGAAGMDLVLLVIAADEGMMPQTKEHIDILRLLGVKKSIVVITKKDLVEEDWLELVCADVRDQLKDTPYHDDDMVVVSAKTGENIDLLKDLMAKTISQVEPKQSSGQPRLPIDRAFSMKGFGTIVTGTLWSGQIDLNDQLYLLPAAKKVRARNIQVHGEDQAQAYAGQRVALNLSDVEVKEIEHGSVLVVQGLFEPSYRLDMAFFLLEDQEPLEHRSRVHVHLGTSEVIARVYLLDRDILEAGETALVQLQCESPISASREDRIVLRNYSPVYTLGGGHVIDPNPPKHRRFDEETLERLRVRLEGTPQDLVLQDLYRTQISKPAEIAKRTQLDLSLLNDELQLMIKEKQVVSLADQVVATKILEQKKEKLDQMLRAYQDQYSLRLGVSKEEVRNKFFIDYTTKAYNALLALLVEEESIAVSANVLHRPDFLPSPNEEEKKAIGALERIFIEAGMSPPSPSSLIGDDGQIEEYLLYLLGQQRLIKLSEEVILAKDAYIKATEKIRSFLLKHQEIKLSDARDLLDSSRKYVLPLLENLDEKKITKRIEDKRILVTK